MKFRNIPMFQIWWKKNFFSFDFRTKLNIIFIREISHSGRTSLTIDFVENHFSHRNFVFIVSDFVYYGNVYENLGGRRLKISFFFEMISNQERWVFFLHFSSCLMFDALTQTSSSSLMNDDLFDECFCTSLAHRTALIISTDVYSLIILHRFIVGQCWII